MKHRIAHALNASDWLIRWGASGLAWVGGLRYFWRNVQDPGVWWRIHYSHPEWLYGIALLGWFCLGGIITSLIFAAVADLLKAGTTRLLRGLAQPTSKAQ